MKSNVYDQILEAVKTSLPSIQVEAISNLIKENDKLNDQVPKLATELQSEKDKNLKLTEELTKSKNTISDLYCTNSKLEGELKEIKDIKDNYEIYKRDLKIESLIQINKSLSDFFGMVFKSDVYRNTMTGVITEHDRYGNIVQRPFSLDSLAEKDVNIEHIHEISPGCDLTGPSK